jgi:hypothetical protein
MSPAPQPAWVHQTACMSDDARADLALLPSSVQTGARCTGNGEVEWTVGEAPAALQALAAAGFRTVGLDLRRYDEAGGTWEVPWWSSSTADASERDALAALDRFRTDDTLHDFEWVLITWTR